MYKKIGFWQDIEKTIFIERNNVILRVADNTFIPTNAPNNTDFQEYLNWLAQGNTPLPADE
jgi:hypothetical protein